MKVSLQHNGPCAATQGPRRPDNTDTILLPVVCSTDIQAFHKKNSSQGLQTLWTPRDVLAFKSTRRFGTYEHRGIVRDLELISTSLHVLYRRPGQIIRHSCELPYSSIASGFIPCLTAAG